ncbi:WD40 repeat domain-containing protein [Paludisphaera soli]|uniref:WD40 repeat domain-containing protein n=1 Tax=Paludisphaera soli TaxID=2712865 RepID=UPI0013EA23CB|nr:hypothetical protein [Paludisphaera soli]
MDHDQGLDQMRDDGNDGSRRVRGGRVRLAWLSWEAAIVLVVSAIVAIILSARLEVEEPDGRKGGATVGGHDLLLEAMALGADRDVLISSGMDGSVRFWDLDPAKASWCEEVFSLPHGSQPYALAPSADGRYLAVGGASHLTVWESGPDGWRAVVTKEGAEFRYLAFAPDSRTLAAGGESGGIRLLRVPDLREEATLDGLGDMVHSVGFSADGSRVAASSFAGDFLIWDRATGREDRLSRNFGRVHCFAFTADGRSLATAPWRAGQGGAKIWDLRTGELKHRLGGDVGYNALAFSPDGGSLAAAGVDQAIQVWDARSGVLRGRLSEGVGWVKAVLFTQGGSRVAYGGRDGGIRFWDVPGAKPEVEESVGATTEPADAPAG